MYKIHLLILALACGLAMQASAAPIPVTYNFTGAPTGPPVMVGTTLVVDGLFTGSILSSDPTRNANWNPVTYMDHSVIDLTTGLLNGTFVMTFANEDKLFGKLFEDVSQVIPTGGMGGAFTQAFTFTGGTGEFAGATGSLSGAGVAGPAGRASGSGTINTSPVPEPASAMLFLSGMAVLSGLSALCRPLRLDGNALSEDMISDPSGTSQTE